jgi:ribosomal protein S18 acetylase RimI-like enzyme
MMYLKIDSKKIGLLNLKQSSIDKAAERLNEAFDEDPCLKYFLGSEEYNSVKAKNLHLYTLKVGLLYGSILTTSELLEGISIWLPPTRVDVSPWMFIRAGGLSLIWTVRKDILKIMKEYGDYSSKIHHKNVVIPHWYLFSIGVGKEYQGKGFAGKMLTPVLNYFDQSGYPCYLETHNPKNIKFYENYGFKVVEVGILPDSEKKHYAMLRMPVR